MKDKSVWKRCPTCINRFEAPTERELDDLLRDHIVTTEFNRQCMNETQLKLSFRKVGNSWFKK